MRTQKEIQRAHDILHIAITEFPKAKALRQIHVAHDAMAWILGFPCGQTFIENIQNIEAGLVAAGLELVDAGEPISEKEARKRGVI